MARPVTTPTPVPPPAPALALSDKQASQTSQRKVTRLQVLSALLVIVVAGFGYKSYAKYTLELSRAGDALLRTHGKAIADFQHQQKRIADIAIDLFVGLCVHSRADTIAKEEPAKAEATLVLAEVFAKQAKRRMARNLRALLSNEDKQMDAIAAATLARGEYVWDVI